MSSSRPSSFASFFIPSEFSAKSCALTGGGLILTAATATAETSLYRAKWAELNTKSLQKRRESLGSKRAALTADMNKCYRDFKQFKSFRDRATTISRALSTFPRVYWLDWGEWAISEQEARLKANLAEEES